MLNLCSNRLKSNSPLHNLKHTTNQSPTWLQNLSLDHYCTSSIIKSNNTSFNPKLPPERTIVVSLDLSKAFDTVNIHLLIQGGHKIPTFKFPEFSLIFQGNMGPFPGTIVRNFALNFVANFVAYSGLYLMHFI